MLLIKIPHAASSCRVITDPFGHDVSGTSQGSCLIRHCLVFFLGLDQEALSLGLQFLSCGSLMISQPLGQGLETFFPGHGGPGSSTGSEGSKRIFQSHHGLSLHDLLAEGIGEQLTFFQGLEDGLSPGFEFGQLLEAITNRGDGHLIQ